MNKKGYSKKNTFNPNANKIPSLIPGMKAIGIHLIKASFEIDTQDKLLKKHAFQVLEIAVK